MGDLNKHIKKSHLKAVKEFNAQLEAFARETGESPVTLYEDALTSFTLSDVHVEDGWLKFTYDGNPDAECMVEMDALDGKYYEIELDGIMDHVKFWRACLRRASRYWSMDSEKLDKIQDGETEDDEEEEEL